MENENTVEVIKNRSYVACLSQGMSHPAFHFRVIIKALWPTLVAAMLLAALSAFLPEFAMRLLALVLVLALLKVAMVLQVNVMIRKLVELGYIPEMKPRVLWSLVPKTRLLFHPHWRYTLRLLGVALMAWFVAALVWAFVSLPCFATTLVDALDQINVLINMDPTALPAGFPWFRAAANVLTTVGVFVAMLLFLFPVAFSHGSIIADEQERNAAQVTES